MKALVLYRSKSGFVRKYAEWIAQALPADLSEASRFDLAGFAGYDAVVYGGGLYAVGINGVGIITRNLDKLSGKKVVVFASGASLFSDKVQNEVRDRNFTPEQQHRIKFYYLSGGFNFSKLAPVDKVLMTLLKWKIRAKKSENRCDDEKRMLAAFDRPVDFTRKEKIDEIVAYINSYYSEHILVDRPVSSQPNIFSVYRVFWW